MTLKVAINGYGRIGRNVLRAIYESGRRNEIQIVAINDLGNIDVNAHLTRFDSTHGRFNADVVVGQDNTLLVNGDEIRLFATRDPKQIPWGELGVDIVLECTGSFCSKEKSAVHLESGAKKVLISAPAGNDLPTVVYGVNHDILKPEDRIVSNASCTTNCLAPIAKILNDNFGITTGLMNTVHAYTNDQVLLDIHHKDIRRARSATQSMIPTKTGAAAAVGLVLPELDGKLDGFSIRVPTMNVSVVDLTCIIEKPATVAEINDAVRQAAQGPMKGILGFNELPLVSCDFNHQPESSTFDATQTKVSGQLVKVLSWYDNEWGFSNRMLDTALAMGKG
ncbi:MAG: type I glyceraldehyde-3-phosphate dehydrogenase [Legionellales bacterium]|nr:type I glyceraldehyde-3-phosphate dehydrogenase [Legionellales bacterium]|tara:strand:+ start:605 stop:1612 length:1008 start_codon:yes stop_codon:yes gene_type:complete